MDKLKKILNGIWILLNSKFFYFGILLIIGILYFNQCNKTDDLKREKIKTDQNLDALNDTLKKVKKKNGNLEVSISGYIAENKDLKSLSNNLYNQIEQQSGEILSLGNANINLKQENNDLKKYINTLEKKLGEFTMLNDSTYSAPWTLTYTYDSLNYDKFEGLTTIGVRNKPFSLKLLDTDLTYRESQINLTWGQKVEDGKLRIFAESKHPAFNISSMEGVLIDPNNSKYIKDLIEKDHWFTGFGVGPNFDFGYDIINQRTSIVIGVGVHYNIYQW